MTVREKVRRVAILLERSLGIPKQPVTLPRPLDVLIATVLSQNTNDKNSHGAYIALRRRFRSWEEVAGAPVRSIVATIRKGGMADQKARRIKSILKEIRTREGSYDLDSLRRLSNDEIMDSLTSLPGVGPKTAACVILFSLGRDIFPVDTHVHRICGRLGIADGSRTPEETFRTMARRIPEGKGYSFHTNLIRFGRMVCRATQPLCGECPLVGLCLFEGKSVRRRRIPSGADHRFMLLDNVAP